MTPSPRQITPASADHRAWPRHGPRRRRGQRACRPASTSGRRSTSRSASTSDVGEHDELPAEDRTLARAGARGPPRPRAAGRRRRAGIFGTGADRRPPRRHRRRRVRRAAAADARARVRPRGPRRLAARPRPRGGDRRRARRRPDGDRRASLGAWPEHKHGWLSRILGDSDEITEEVTELLTAWLPLYQEIEPRVTTIIERDVALRAGDRSTPRPRRAHRAHDQRHPLAVRAGRPPRRPRAVVPRAAVQLHVRRRRLADVRLPGRGRRPRAQRPARAAGRRAAAAPGAGRRDAAADPAPPAGPRLVPDRDRRAARALASRPSSTTSRSSGPPAS